MTERPPEDEASRAALAASAADVGAALATAMRGAQFYEADHPVVAQQKRDLEAAIRVWQVNADGETVIAAAGEVLLLTGLEEGIGNDAAKAVCASMVAKSVVGVRLKAPLTLKDLGEFVNALAENDRRVRAAGGFTKILHERGAKGVIPTEMDLDQLLNGAPIDPVGLEPLVAKALTEVLALKQRTNRRGEAVALTLERVTTPSSLGSLLDDLIDGAAPGVAEAGPQTALRAAKTSSSPLTGVNADDLAELAAEAYGKVTKGQQSPEALAEAARVLSSALVRLSPEARFKLLQKIAGGNQNGAEAVGKQVPNPVLLSAIAQVVMGGERDSKLASAVAGLLERMRPLERDRQKLIDELDDMARAKGRPLEGLFMQELNELSQKKTFGALDLPFRETKDGLLQAARVRQSTRGQPDIVTKTFASMRAENRVQRTARLLVGMLDEERTVVPATLASVRSVLTLSATDPSLADAGGAIILGLWNRALRDGPMSPAARQLADLASSPNGPDWCIALLQQLRAVKGVDTARLLGDFVKSVLAVHHGETFRRRLVDALHGLDRTVLRPVERRIAEFSPAGVTTLVQRAGRDSPPAALALAQAALRASALDVKEAALRALAAFPDEVVLGWLKKASGLEGDGISVQTLLAQKEGPPGLVRLQRAAIESLGATRSAAAVPILAELLTRQKLVGGAELDKLRVFAARALAVNSTREARLALDDARRSKNRAVRIAAGGQS